MSKISQDKIDYINNHLDMPNKELASILNIHTDTVRRYKKLQGVVYQPKNFHEYDQYIVDNYYTKTSIELAKEIGCSKSYIIKIWGENNLKGKGSFMYHFDGSYFDKIDTDNKAYVIGLLASDGCLYKRENHQGLIQLSLQKVDEQILKDILIDFKSNYPINTTDKMCSFSITNDKAFNRLNEIGLHPKKTWTIDIKEILSNIPKEHWRGFFRGYFDGDGCITSVDHFKTLSGVSINYALPKNSGLIFEKELNSLKIECRYSNDNRTEKYKDAFGRVVFNNTTAKYCFLKWLYKNADLKLERKSVLANNFICGVEENITNRSENIDALEYYHKWFE